MPDRFSVGMESLVEDNLILYVFLKETYAFQQQNDEIAAILRC